jgi:TonB-linked SusC/RagA family outer membrane protein
MRWIPTLLVTALALAGSTSYGQITLKEKSAPLEKVLSDIEKQTKYVFLYDPDVIKPIHITISIKNATLEQTLNQLFKDLPIQYTLVDNNVLLKTKLTTNTQHTPDIIIHGKVIDSVGQPLPGVTVFNKRERKATATDTSGAYTLKAAKGDLLRFSFVGYKDRDIIVGDQPLINAILEINSSSADQVVVIGYGSSKRKDLTGAVSVVDIQDFSTTPYNTLDNALAGKAAGVEVTKTDGTPGGMSRIRIRGTSSLLGSNDPLYVIDGIPVQVRNNFINPGFYPGSPAANISLNLFGTGFALQIAFVNGLNNLGGVNPDDIASITVLKDASSTAIYGSKAANGVVIITTKTGNVNSLPRVAVNYYTTVNSTYKTPKLLNVSQYKTLLTEAAQNAFAEDSALGDLTFAPTNILDSPAYFGTANTNWIKTVTHATISNNVGLSVSGGGQASRYFSSVAYSNTPGVLDGTGFRRVSGNLNLETQIGSKLKITTNLLAGFANQDIANGVYMQALLARPDLAPRDAMGNFTDFSIQAGSSLGFLNPSALLTATDNARTLSLLGSFSAGYTLFNDLRFKSTVSLNMQNYNQRNYLPGYIPVTAALGYVTSTNGIGANANSRFADWFLENTLTYTKELGRHSLNAVIGQSYETTKYSYFSATASGYPNNTTLTGLSSASTALSVAGEDPRGPQSYLLSFYARGNYSYLDKYLFTFTGRADGSSKFGPANKYGYFPSSAIAWRVSRENFLKDIGWISDIKLRGSYGLIGNQNIGDQMYRTLYSPAAYAGTSALVPTQLGNQGIKWESTKEGDAGFDVALFTGRLNATFDYYNRKTSGDLLWLPVAASSSYTSLLENAVGLRNRGFEASVGGDIIHSRRFKWAASINVTWNNSLVTKLDPRADLTQIISPTGLEQVAVPAIQYPGNTILAQGKPLGLLAVIKVTGLIRTQAQLDAYDRQLGYWASITPPQIGDPMYQLDSTGSPVPNAFIINCAPKYFGGMSQEFSFKQFDLQCYFTFSHGGHLFWVEHVATEEFLVTANAGRSMLNLYTLTNTSSNVPRLSLNDQYQASNLDVFGSSYFKLRSLTLSYRFDKRGWMKKAAITNAQVFVSATNVFTLTKYPGGDPETSDDPYSVNNGYIDASNYPATRTFSLGLKATF